MTLFFDPSIFLLSHSSKMYCLISFIQEGDKLLDLNHEFTSIEQKSFFSKISVFLTLSILETMKDLNCTSYSSFFLFEFLCSVKFLRCINLPIDLDFSKDS